MSDHHDSDSRDEELALLHEAAGLLGRTLDPVVIYETLRSMTARVMDCASLLVSIHTPEDNLIRCVYAWVDDRDMDVSQFPPIPLAEEGAGVQSRVIRSGEALIIPDAIAAEKTQATRYYAHDDGTVTKEARRDKPRVRSLEGIVQVRVSDHGEGIAVENLPRATLERGHSTKATLGHGMKMMLQTTDALWLLTGTTGTTVVLVQQPRSPETEESGGWW